MSSSLVIPSLIDMDDENEFFRMKEGEVEFANSMRVETVIPGAPLGSVQEYLSDPRHLVHSCWKREDIQEMDVGLYRLSLRGQRFLTVPIDMHIDVQFTPEGDGQVKCKSVGYSTGTMRALLGPDFDSYTFSMEGKLRAEETETKVRALKLKSTILNGNVGIAISGKIPALLAPTPEPLVRKTAHEINRRVLNLVVGTFVETVKRGYQKWAREQRQGSAP